MLSTRGDSKEEEKKRKNGPGQGGGRLTLTQTDTRVTDVGGQRRADLLTN